MSHMPPLAHTIYVQTSSAWGLTNSGQPVWHSAAYAGLARPLHAAGGTVLFAAHLQTYTESPSYIVDADHTLPYL